MLYLEESIMHDIAYDVHRRARFLYDPKYSHKIGLKHIARYLKTRNKRLLMKPNANNLKSDLFADANFVGLFTAEDNQDPISVNSRTIILLNFGRVPIFWSSKF